MAREELVAQLSSILHPIVTDIAVFDETCTFRLITPSTGYEIVVGGAFPLIGPLRISAAQRAALDTLSDVTSEEALSGDSSSDETDPDGEYEQFPWHGEGAVRDLIRLDLGVGEQYYMFNDMGRGDSAAFRRLDEAFDYLVSYYEMEDGFSWADLTEDQLREWAESVENWRSRGAQAFPPEEYLGLWYSAAIGGGQIGREHEG